MDAPTETKKRGPGRPPKVEEVEEVIGTPGTVDVSKIQEAIESAKESSEPQLESVVPSQVLDLRHVFRTISSQGILDMNEDLYPREVVEDYLNQNYFSQGYTLYKVEHLRTKISAEGNDIGEYMLYILVKYAQ